MSKGPWTVSQFAYRTGISENRVRELIKLGRIIGVSQHPLTKRWLIYPPAKILLSAKGAW